MKTGILLIFLLCGAMLIGGVACKTGSPYGGINAEQIMQNMQAAQQNISSCHIDTSGTTSGTIQVTGSAQSSINTVTNGSGDFDRANRSMYMNVNVSMDMGAVVHNVTERIQTYMMNNWMYMKMDVLGQTQWMKMELPDEFWDQQENSLLQYEELINNSIEAHIIGEEIIGNTSCWKLSIQPDMESLLRYAQSRLKEILGNNILGNLPSGIDFSNMFRNTNVVMWIDKDTYYVIRYDVAMDMDIEVFMMHLSMTGYYSNFNQPVTITLPAEASNAEEVSY